ncbi:hypothetical protein [Methanobrevibacter sp.]|uniref:hypothetical protein n=1 Tax=Methanobrevibacter sp. TaxID=66852 RepID=UPI00388E2E4C
MDTFEKLKRSWWVLFPFTLALPGFGFIYIGLKSDNKNWVLEGITYELPLFFYFLTSAIYSFGAMAPYYVVLMLLAVLVAFIRSVMLAIKLLDVYDNEASPKITQTGSSGSVKTSIKDKDSNWPACCGCLVLIFIIFAIITIL